MSWQAQSRVRTVAGQLSISDLSPPQRVWSKVPPLAHRPKRVQRGPGSVRLRYFRVVGARDEHNLAGFGVDHGYQGGVLAHGGASIAGREERDTVAGGDEVQLVLVAVVGRGLRWLRAVADRLGFGPDNRSADAGHQFLVRQSPQADCFFIRQRTTRRCAEHPRLLMERGHPEAFRGEGQGFLCDEGVDPPLGEGACVPPVEVPGADPAGAWSP